MSITATTLDPARTANPNDYLWMMPIYDRLTDITAGAPKPMLATGWTVAADDLSIEFKLRSGVTFSDGTAFDADAVKQNLDRDTTDPKSTIKSSLSSVKSVTVVDPTTVKIETKTPTAALLPTTLGFYAGMMVSPKAFADPNLGKKGSGTGPFKVDSNSGGTISYSKYDGYYNPSAQKVSKIIASTLADDQTRLNALLSGSVDSAYVVFDQVDQLKQGGYTVDSLPSPGSYLVPINMGQSALGNVKVRQAMNYAIDRKSAVEGGFGGGCDPSSVLLSDTFWGKQDGTDPYPFDVQKAKQLMTEAGYPNGFTLTMNVINIPSWANFGAVIQSDLAKIGITVKLNVSGGSDIISQYIVDQSVNSRISSLRYVIDPSQLVDSYYGGGAENVSKFSDPQIDKLAAQAAASQDPTERQGLYQQIQQIITDQALNPIVICRPYSYWAFAPGVTGFVMAPNGLWSFNDIQVAKK
jgi:peptide/nickel transport system substrate-binding protein